MCAFEVLETCPEERSGPKVGEGYENCPNCKLARYCLDVPEGVEPKAKRSDGHYPIESLIQKLDMTGTRVFEADYLCMPSTGDAAWFPRFQVETHVSPEAEFVPGHKVHLAVDTGVFTGAVLFQVVEKQGENGPYQVVHVFADLLTEGHPAEANARAIRSLAGLRCEGIWHHAFTDPAGKSRNAIGPTVLAEYARSSVILDPWPLAKVADSLALLESFIAPSFGPPQLLVHPRCDDLIRAFQCYRRAKKFGQWTDKPEDPQHPHEDLIDALRGGLRAMYPEGRIPPTNLTRVSARSVL